MKSALLISVAFAAILNPASSQWTRLNASTKNTLYDVAFYSARLGYITGAKGVVLRTKDGGSTWTALPSPDSTDVTSIVIIDSVTIIVTTGSSTGHSAIYKSTTQGNSWHKVLHDTRTFYATSSPNGTLYSTSTYVYGSNDHGETWTAAQRLNSTSTYTELEFPDNHNGYIGGNISGANSYTAEFLRSDNAGQRWYPSYPFAFPDTTGFSSMSAINADSVFMFTNWNKHFKLRDTSELLLLTRFVLRRSGADTVWNFKAKVMMSGMRDRINDCKFFEGGAGYAVSNVGIIYKTTTYGKKWTKDFSGKTALHGIFMMNENNGYAVGDSGLILALNFAPFFVPPPIPVPQSNDVNTNVFPNPATNQSIIKFTLTQPSNIALQLSDDKGTIVYTIQNKQYDSGTYQIVIPVANLKGGMYHINLMANGKSISKQNIVVMH
jgi:photosystem II stability/assembly factor-like uncharacterized protein